jgi:hypothetical protein
MALVFGENDSRDLDPAHRAPELSFTRTALA